MKRSKALFGIISGFLGIVIGIAISLLIGAILCYVDPWTSLTSHPKTFGDVKVWVQKPNLPADINVPDELFQEDSKELWMAKDDVPFLVISQNEGGKTNRLYLIKNKDNAIFWMDPLSTPGKWGYATYDGTHGNGKPLAGEVFIDVDFDGRFDFKLALDDNGKPISRSILVDGVWQKIDHCSFEARTAIAGQISYTFDPNSGWQKE